MKKTSITFALAILLAAITFSGCAGNNSDKEKNELFSQVEKSVKEKNYEEYGKLAKEIYNNKWQEDKIFQDLESELYGHVTDEYYAKENYEKSLEIATTIYDYAPFGWRFPYMRITSLEKIGRQYFDKGDLVTAEQYASSILTMEYRPEGAILLADITLERIKAAIEAGDMDEANSQLNFIKDFELPDATIEKFKEVEETLANS